MSLSKFIHYIVLVPPTKTENRTNTTEEELTGTFKHKNNQTNYSNSRPYIGVAYMVGDIC